MIQPEELVGGEWAEWYRLTPVQRWLESEKLCKRHTQDRVTVDVEKNRKRQRSML